MQLKWLEDFLILAQTGSFTRAADVRHVTHPAFGRRIRSLEVWAGVPLVDRASFPTQLTPEGQVFFEVAGDAVRMLQEARANVRKMHGEGQDLLSLATGKTLSRTLLPDWLIDLQAKAGLFKVRLHSTSMHDAAALLVQGSADLLFCYFHPAVQFYLDEQLFEYRLVCLERLIPVCAPDRAGAPRYPLAGKGQIPFLSYSRDLTMGHVLSDFLHELPDASRLMQIHESDFAESLQELALKGAGLAWLPESLVRNDLEARRLVRAAGPETEIALEIRVYRSRDNEKPLMQRVWAHV